MHSRCKRRFSRRLCVPGCSQPPGEAGQAHLGEGDRDDEGRLPPDAVSDQPTPHRCEQLARLEHPGVDRHGLLCVPGCSQPPGPPVEVAQTQQDGDGRGDEDGPQRDKGDDDDEPGRDASVLLPARRWGDSHPLPIRPPRDARVMPVPCLPSGRATAAEVVEAPGLPPGEPVPGGPEDVPCQPEHGVGIAP